MFNIAKLLQEQSKYYKENMAFSPTFDTVMSLFYWDSTSVWRQGAERWVQRKQSGAYNFHVINMVKAFSMT